MKANTARQYRLYPTPEQATRLTQWGHTCRTLYNVALEQRQYVWSQHREHVGVGEQSRALTIARSELEWIADLPAQSGQQVLRHLDVAYENWWNRDHHSGRPRFKKRRARLSIRSPARSSRSSSSITIGP
jgi:transposase